MRRLLTLGAMFLCSLLTAMAQLSGTGKGTEDDPYKIFNVTQLSQLSNFVGQSGVVFRLMQDIDVSQWITDNNPRQGWTPVGVSATPFQGKLLGENHKITGLVINRSSESNVGFFGYLSGATITDLTIEGSDVTGGSNVGAFVGYATNSTLTNCHIKLTGKVSSSNGNYVGGFAGTVSNCTVSNFSVEATVISTGANYVGGFAGSVANGTALSNGLVVGNVTSNKPYVGGFAGNSESANIADVIVKGNVSGTTYVGGFIGKSDATDNLSRCTYEGNLTGQEYVGGISAYLTGGSSSTFTSCFSKGKITASGDYVGGIVGVTQGGCIAGIESCSHFGDIEAGSYVGGLIGAMVNTTSAPSLATFTIYRATDTEYKNGTYVPKSGATPVQKTIETIENGTAKNNSINSCTVIGNINGKSYIGGLIGYECASAGYTPNAKTSSRKDAYYNQHLFKNGVYANVDSYHCGGKSDCDYCTISYTHSYTKNSVSLVLSNSYYSGDIEGADNIGGLVGYKLGGMLNKNYSYATIRGDNNVGGIVGQLSTDGYGLSTVVNSNVSNNVSISAKANVGRIYGIASNASIGALGSTQGNRALVTTKVVKSGILQEVNDDLQNGTSIGANALKLKATYGALGWNYDTDWNQLETESYPYKKYQAAPPTITSTLESQATTISGKSTNGGTVYLYYKDKEPVSTVCNGNDWSFTTEPLQSGAQVQVYADAEGMTPSYFSTTTVKYPGLGTQEAPYLIYTAEDLQGVNKSGYYKVMNDIDLTAWINENSPTEGWQAIGMNGSEAVYIDGDYHKIKGLWTNTTKDFSGLFSSFLVGQIKNLTVEVATGKKVKGGDYTGILIGRMANAKISNCTVKGDVEGTLHVGGVAGALDNTELSTLTYSGNVTTTTAEAYSGGITGLATDGSMTSCQAEATVNGTLYVGGLAGFISQADLESLTFSGSLSSSAESAFVGGLFGKTETCMLTGGNAMPTITTNGSTAYVGGVIGYADGGEITKTVANDNITSSGTGNYVGGLVGYSDAVVSQCNANGTVTATGENSYAGGLIAYATNSVADSYATANVKGTLYVAGLVAYTFSTIDKCYAKGNVTGQFNGGGVVGYMDGANAAITNSVAMNNTLSLTAQTAWACRVIGGYGNGCPDPNNSNYALKTMQVSLNGSPQQKYDDIMEGVSKTQTELTQSSTYAGIGWDMSNTWGINEGTAYPYLLWEVSANPVAEITLDNTSLLIAVGKTATIKATVLPVAATNKRLAWTSDNSQIATVEDGVVTALKEGTANITVASTDGSNVSATCKITVTANKDAAIAQLQELVDKAQTLYENSTEGEEIGQYASGSRATLLAAIQYVNERISSTMSDETLAECMNVINEAIATFESQKVSIGEDTDISQLTDAIYINAITAGAGSELNVDICLKNKTTADAWSFDLYLPEGVSLAKDNKNKYIKNATDRNSYHSITLNYQEAKGCYSFAAYSSDGDELTGNDGAIVSVKFLFSEDLEEGKLPLIISNARYSYDMGESSLKLPTTNSSITIESYTKGDVNNDGEIDIADAVKIVNYIVGKSSGTFVEKAADVNGDEEIDIADAVKIVNYIVGKTASLAPALEIIKNNIREPQ